MLMTQYEEFIELRKERATLIYPLIPTKGCEKMFEMIFILGSITYPKDMHKAFQREDKQNHDKIEFMSKAFQSFSKVTLHSLLKSNCGFRCLLMLAFTNKEQVFESILKDSTTISAQTAISTDLND